MSGATESLFTRGFKSSLLSTPISDGNIRFVVDTKQLFIDNGVERISISDLITEYTEDEILDILAPLPKIYLSSDTHKFFIYNNGWAECGPTDVLKAKKVIIKNKSYSGIYGMDNTMANSSFYYASIVPNNFYMNWHVKCKLNVIVPNQNVFGGFFEVEITGCKNEIVSYKITNNHSNTSYKTISSHILYPINITGYGAGYGHLLGVGLRASQNYSSSEYARSFVIESIEEDNCTLTFLDSMNLYIDCNGHGTDNYLDYIEINGTSQGLQETNDDAKIDRICMKDSTVYASGTGIMPNNLFMQLPDGTYQSLTTTYSSGTTKIPNMTGFIPYNILYHDSPNIISNGNMTSKSSVMDACKLDFRYSLNCGTSLLVNKPVYLVGSIGENGLFYLDRTQYYTQNLPTRDDGKVYIHIGIISSTDSAYGYLSAKNTVYQYKDGGVREYSYNTDTVDKIKIFRNIQMNASAFVEDSTYEDYPYRATITCDGINSNYSADVRFNMADAISANFCTVCETLADGVYIYSKVAPDHNSIIPCIVCTNAIYNDSNIILNFLDRTVAVADFVADETYEEYPYKATIICNGVTADHTPDIIFSVNDSTSGNYALVAESSTDRVYIFAKEIPASNITIPCIICTNSLDTGSTNNILTYKNVAVPVANFIADETYVGYPYRAFVSCPGVTTDYSPDVRMSIDDNSSGVYSTISESLDGGIYIYAFEVPADTLVIPYIVCTNVVTTVNPASSVLTFNNVSVLTSRFISDTTYEEFPYKAAITCLGVTTNHSPDVRLSAADNLLGIFSKICESGTNTIYIYATEVPANTLIIPCIICTKIA